MRMTGLEKMLVNRPAKGRTNVTVVHRQLAGLRAARIEHILELGTGAGDVAEFLARQLGYQVIGVDIDPGQVALARARHGDVPGLEFAVADAAHLTFATGRFDLVIAQNVFHHVSAWRQVVTEIARVVREGGCVLWLDLTLPPPMDTILGPLRRWFGVYTLNQVREAFSEAGFEALALRRTIPWLPLRHELVLRKSRDRTGSAMAGSSAHDTRVANLDAENADLD